MRMINEPPTFLSTILVPWKTTGRPTRLRSANEKEGATTEDLRTAMIHYRSLFEELVQVPTAVEIKEVA